MPVVKATAASSHRLPRPIDDSSATRPMPSTSTTATATRMRRCGTRSATTPATRAGRSTPMALAVVTNDRSRGPPPRAMTSQTSATTQTPAAKELAVSDTASQR